MRALLKRWWFWGLLAIPFALVVGLLHFPPLDPTQRKFNQIKDGMTKAQIAEIMESKGEDRDWSSHHRWFENGGIIYVQFDTRGLAVYKLYRPPYQPTVIERIRSWLRRYI
jgi:hypothetical protein